MDSSGPRFQVRQLAPSMYIVFVEGELDHASAGRLTRLVSDLLADGAQTLRFDLSEVVFFDAGGVRALVATVGLAATPGRR